MAIVSVSQLGPGRAGEGNSEFNRSYTVVFQVIVNDPMDGIATVGNAIDPVTGNAIPGRFQPYVGYENTDDPQALCTSAHPQQDGEEWQKWTVSCNFETNFTNEDNQPSSDSPDEDPPIRWVEIEFEKVKVTKEYDGTPIRNSAGQLIAGLEDDEVIVTLCFERNELDINPGIGEYNNAKNNDTFYFMAPGQGLMRITADKPQYRNGIQFYKHTYKVRYREQGWDVRPADVGTGVLDSDNKITRPIDPATNQARDGEFYLDGTGHEIEDALNDPIHFLPIKQIKRPMPFGALNLGG